MKRIALFLIVAVALTSTVALGAKEKKGRSKGKGGLRGEYATMAKVLELTAAQKAELTEKVAACNAEAKKWREDNAEKLAAFKKRAAEAPIPTAFAKSSSRASRRLLRFSLHPLV